MRRIVVDRLEYTWKAGTGVIEVRKDGQTMLRINTAEALGLTPDQHERAIENRSQLCSVTPSLVADLIRKAVLAGRP